MNLKKIKKYRISKSSADKLLVTFSKDKLSEVTSKQSNNFNLEIIENNKLGTSSSNLFDEKVLIEKALMSSLFGDMATYDYPKEKSYPQVKVMGKEVNKITPNKLIDLGKEIIEDIKKEDKDILVDIYLDKTLATSTLENSRGLSKKIDESYIAITASGELVKNQDILTIDKQYIWRDFYFNKKEFISEIRTKFKNSKKLAKIETGKFDIIFTQYSLATLLSFFETALSGENVYKKVSKWGDKLGNDVTDKRFSLIDDPLFDYALGSTSVDDEGFAMKTVTLIENGVLKNFYLDLKNSSRLKLKPNGRGFGFPAKPNLTNLVVGQGTIPSSDILRKTKRGLLIYDVIGGGQDSPFSGDFSLNIHLGFLINNGEIVGRVKNCMVTGNVFEMVKNQLAEISSDREWYGGDLLLPQISFEGVNIISTI